IKRVSIMSQGDRRDRNVRSRSLLASMMNEIDVHVQSLADHGHDWNLARMLQVAGLRDPVPLQRRQRPVQHLLEGREPWRAWDIARREIRLRLRTWGHELEIL